MSILIANSISVTRRHRVPVKPTRHTSRPDRPFGEGLFERRQPYTAADLAWAAYELNKDATDYVVVARATQLGSEWDRWHRTAAPETADANEPVGVLAGWGEID